MKTITKTLLLGITALLLFSGTTAVAEDCSPEISLPSGYVTMLAVDGENSWFNITLSDVPTGYDIVDGTYSGWCLQRGIFMPRDVHHAVTLNSSYDENLPELFQNDNWSKVNYIINNKQDYSRTSIQNAIWYFIDNYDSSTDVDAQELIDDANANGEDFCPVVGQSVAIILECVQTVQRTIVELTIPDESTGGETPGETPLNHPPTADAYLGEPYGGFVGEEITFDGSNSYDRDGEIVSYLWDFGDLTFGESALMAHIYTEPGTYTVTFTVTDDDDATDTYETSAEITIDNYPPSNPVILGPTIGEKRIDYVYDIVSSDLENETIKYVIDWGDESELTETNYTGSNTSVNASHNWTDAGVYHVSVYAKDFRNETSESTRLLVFIDVNVEFIDDELFGYLIDYDKTGIFDVFYNNETGYEIGIEKQEDGTYLIDIDSDGEWDYSFDMILGSTVIQEDVGEEEKTPGFEIIFMFVAIGIILFLRKKK